MIETAVLAIFALAMLSLAAALWGLSRQLPGPVSDTRGAAGPKRG